MLNHMASEGIDLRKHRIEFMKYEPFLIGSRGIEIDQNAETNIKGLYAAGDEVGNVREILRGQPPLGGLPVRVLRRGQKGIKDFRRLKKAFLSRIGEALF